MELADHVLPAFDPEVSEALEAELAENGVTVRVGTMVQSLIEEDGRIVGAVLSRGDGTEEIPAEELGEPATEESGPESIEATYHVTGVRRKELVAAVGGFIGAKPE